MLHLTWMQASPSNHGGAETRIATNGPARRRALPDLADAQRYKHFSTGGIGTLKPCVSQQKSIEVLAGLGPHLRCCCPRPDEIPRRFMSGVGDPYRGELADAVQL